MKPLSYLEKRRVELQKAIELLNQDLQGAELICVSILARKHGRL